MNRFADEADEEYELLQLNPFVNPWQREPRRLPPQTGPLVILSATETGSIELESTTRNFFSKIPRKIDFFRDFAR